MTVRGPWLGAVALSCLSYAHAGDQAARLLRYKPAAPLSYVIVESGTSDRVVVMTIDSSKAVAEKDRISMDFRAADISVKRHNQPRRITMSPRGEILDVLVGGRRARRRRQPRLPDGVERLVPERSFREGMGFPLLPQQEVRPGDTWEESFHLAKGTGEGVVFIPVKVTHKYQGDLVLQKRKCAVLSFELSGELELPKLGGTITIRSKGQLVFDYENGCDVRVDKRIIETGMLDRKGARSSGKVRTVVKRLSEIPLLGPPSGGQDAGGVRAPKNMLGDSGDSGGFRIPGTLLDFRLETSRFR